MECSNWDCRNNISDDEEYYEYPDGRIMCKECGSQMETK